MIRDALASVKEEGESDWLTWVEGDAPGDLLLRIDGHYAALFPAIGMTMTSAPQTVVRGEAVPASLRGGWGKIDLGDRGAASGQLRDYLRRIVRARNLIRLAATQAASASGAQVELRLLAVKLNTDLEIESTQPWPADAEQSLVMREDDLFALRVKHPETAEKPMYVTVLAIDPDMEIQAILLHPEGVGPDNDQRLEPGASRISSPYRCTEPHGPHWAIVLATEAPNDFSLLAQPALPRTRSAGGGSPLEELLIEQTYFRTRGSRRPGAQKSADPSWSATILRWDARGRMKEEG